MFYCRECADKNKWTRISPMGRSYGPCEICDKVGMNYNVPSGHLARAPDEHEIAAAFEEAVEDMVLFGQGKL